jgi:serine/threonine protein kinase
LKDIEHPNIIKIHEIIDDEKDSKVYLVMDCLTGGTLEEALEASNSGLPEEKVR